MPPQQLTPFLMRLGEQATSPTEVGLVAELAASSGRPHLVTQVGRYAAYYGAPNHAAAFPIPEIAGLMRPPPGDPEPALLMGVGRQESMFNPWVTSHAGAQRPVAADAAHRVPHGAAARAALQSGPADRRSGLQRPARQPLPARRC